MIFTDSNKREIWINLTTRSRRALTKTAKKFGHKYYYKPRSDLVQNLSRKLNRPPFEIANDLMEMRQDFLKSVRIN